MDILHLTAPCGLDCFNCRFYRAAEDPAAMEELKEISKTYDIPLTAMFCKGCRAHDGRIPLQLQQFGEDHRCAAYECSKDKGHDLCCDCGDFPCDNLHPYADMAAIVPHNTKVFNLCLIKRLGIEKWAEEKAAEVKETYFNKPWTLK